MHNLNFLIPQNNYDEAMMAGYDDGLPIVPFNGDINSKRYKSPLTQNGFKDASTDYDFIHGQWSKHEHAFIAVATGQVSGVYSIDIDVKDVNGFLHLGTLKEELGELPPTLTVKTISGGMHLHFSAPDGVEIPCSVDRDNGIDFRGELGAIIWGGSRNSNGDMYEVIKNIPMAELPQAYIKYFQTKKRTKKAVGGSGFIEEGGRNTNMTKTIGAFVNLGLEGDALTEAAYFFNKTFCKPPLDDWELDTIIESIGNRDRGYAHSPIGNGQRFADRHAGNVRCVNQRNSGKTWMLWDGTKWHEDKYAKVNEYAKQIAIDLHEEHKHLPKNTSETISKSLYAHSKLTQNNPLKTLSMANSEPKLAISSDQFDTHDYLAPCLNGIVDLNTGKFLPHDPSLYYTKLFNANYDPDAKSEDWERYIKFFTNNAPEVEAFLARVYGGIGLIGDNPDHKAIFLLGRGGNGKSTLNEIVQHIMQDYTDVIRAEVLTAKGNRDFRHDIADIKGARFLTVNEPSQDSKINGSFFKSITGGDTNKGRQNYEESEKFKPKGLMSLTSNWEPSMDDGDEGIERRLIVYRQNEKVADADKDVGLSNKLERDSDAIFLWLIKGRMDYLKHREMFEQGLISDPLATPKVIVDMTEDFLNRCNTFRAFLIDRCDLGADKKVQAETLYNTYRNYLYANDKRITPHKEFYQMVANKFGKTLHDGKTQYLGITLKGK